MHNYVISAPPSLTCWVTLILDDALIQSDLEEQLLNYRHHTPVIMMKVGVKGAVVQI